MFSVRAVRSHFGSGLITWGIAMARPVLTDSEMLEIVYDSDESFIDRNSDSVSSSDFEIDDIPVADAIINDDSGDKRKYFTETSGRRLWTVTQDTERCSVVILDPEMV